jgi:hypothetical protein
MYLFAYVAANGQVTTIHYLLPMATRMGQPTIYWDGQNFAMNMDWIDMGIRTMEEPHNM